MKVVFTSCFDAEKDDVQTVWDRISALEPDVLLLLGDSIYMDFGIFGKRHLGAPRDDSLQDFATKMHDLYAKQWGVASFQRLVRSGIKLGMTWDDHDFAWNNSRGAGHNRKFVVPVDKRRVSRGLFIQFRQVLENLPVGSAYPACPSLDVLGTESDAGIQSLFDLGSLRFVMLDGRTFREDPSGRSPATGPDGTFLPGAFHTPTATMHGNEQMNWMLDKLNNWHGIKIVGAGSVMSESKETWAQYLDYQRLLNEAPDRVIVLTGDIHKNRSPRNHRPDGVPLYEVTSSGAARPGPLHIVPRLAGASGNFGVLTVDDGRVEVTLYDRHGAGRPEQLVF